MAAFERVSKIMVIPLGRTSGLDVRTAKLPERTPSIGEFDPRDYRTPTNPIKMWMAYFNLLRIGFGPGMLGMPLAISQAGMILGPLMCLSIGLLLLHTHLVLLWSLTEIARQLHLPYISYRYGFRMALLRGPVFFHGLGRYGPLIIAIFMLLSQIGICTVFVIFITDSIRDICDWPNSKKAIYAFFLPCLLLEVIMKSFKYLSYIAMIGNIMNWTGMVLVFYHFFREPRKEIELLSHQTLQYLFAIGNMLFCSSFVGVILTMDRSLIRPRKLTEATGPLVICLTLITVTATIFGTLGYWAFGTMEENVLRSLPFDDEEFDRNLLSKQCSNGVHWALLQVLHNANLFGRGLRIIMIELHFSSAMAAMGLYMIAVALTYPMQCYPGIHIILEVIKNSDPRGPPSENCLNIIEHILRPLFVFLTFIIAYYVPFQGPFIAFVGNLCTTMISVVFPAMMELSLKYPNNYGKFQFYMVKNCLIIFLGTLSWLVGAILSGYIIYVRILSMKSPNDRTFL